MATTLHETWFDIEAKTLVIWIYIILDFEVCWCCIFAVGIGPDRVKYHAE
jgi:hypothetical protein